MMDLAVDSHGTMYGVADPPSLGAPSRFYSIDTSAGTASLLFSTLTPCIMGLAFDGADNLYGTTFHGASPFYGINLATHAVSTVGTTGLANLHGGDIARVPEPASLALLAVGLAGLGFSRRKH